TALGAARRQLRRRRLREEAAIARTLVRLEDGCLPLEAEDRAVHERDVVPDGRVVDEVAGREVVGAVDDHIPAVVEDPLDVLRGQLLLVGLDLDVGIELSNRPRGRLDPGLQPAARDVDCGGDVPFVPFFALADVEEDGSVSLVANLACAADVDLVDLLSRVLEEVAVRTHCFPKDSEPWVAMVELWA